MGSFNFGPELRAQITLLLTPSLVLCYYEITTEMNEDDCQDKIKISLGLDSSPRKKHDLSMQRSWPLGCFFSSQYRGQVREFAYAG